MKKFILLSMFALLVSCGSESPSSWVLIDSNGKEYRMDKRPRVSVRSGVAYCVVRGEHRLFQDWQEIREVKE